MAVVCLSRLHHDVRSADYETEPAMFVAAFNSEDPGVTQIAQRCMLLSYLCFNQF